MHRVLQIDELLRIAFAKDTPSYKPEFYSLALTCKTFLEPALDGLWFRLTDLNHLFRLWPLDAIGDPRLDTMYNKEDDDVDLIRPLLHYEWSRFEFYARRIRELRLGEYKEPPLLIKNLKRSLLYRRATPFLFPNTRVIQISIYDSSFELPALFLCPKTKEFHPLFNNDYMADLDFWGHRQLVKDITRRGAALESVMLPSLSEEDELSSFSHHVGQSLQSITICDWVDWAGIETLATLPLLWDLHVTDVVCPSESEALVEDYSSWFPSLRKLDACADIVLIILSNIKSGDTFRELQVCNATALVAQDVIKKIGSSFQSIGLLHLCCIDQHSSTLSRLSLSPLITCSQLKSVKISGSQGIRSVSDGEFLKLAQAWPELEAVMIRTSSTRSASLATIAAFSRNCPNLESISIDTQVPGTIPEGLEFGILRNLKELKLGPRRRAGAEVFVPKWLWEKLGCEGGRCAELLGNL